MNKKYFYHPLFFTRLPYKDRKINEQNTLILNIE